VPIIAITGNVSEEKKVECLEAGMKLVLHKPVKMEELLEVIFNLVLQYAPNLV
jgi:DNA-binding response OmpR family regulator